MTIDDMKYKYFMSCLLFGIEIVNTYLLYLFQVKHTTRFSGNFFPTLNRVYQYMNTNQESPILKLPVEVLQLILEFVPDFDRVFYQDESGRQHDHAQLLVIRQVCHTFRIVSHNLPAWRDDMFDFSSLLPSDVDEQLKAFQEGKLLRALFNDNHFVVQLSQKRGWAFSTLESVFAVLHGVPSFPRNAIRLYLELTEGFEIALKRLSVCRCIRNIDLFLDGEIIDLDTFAGFFPTLQNLTLSGLESHIGSLNGLSALRSFNVDIGVPINEFDFSLIPVDSAATLSQLSITSIYGFVSSDFDNNPFDILYSLNDLSLDPYDNIFGGIIVDTTTRLTSLAITLEENIPSLNIIFSSWCLSRLKSFTLSIPVYLLSVHVRDDVLTLGMPIIDAVTSNLSSLETLTLIMGLHLDWSHYFSRLKNLKSLSWTIRYGNHNICEERGGVDLTTEDKDLIIRTKKVFERVFAEFPEKPVFLIRFT